MRTETGEETGCGLEVDREQEGERAVGDTPTGGVMCEQAAIGKEEVLCEEGREKKVQGSTNFGKLVSYVCRIGGKFASLKERIVKLRS